MGMPHSASRMYSADLETLMARDATASRHATESPFTLAIASEKPVAAR